MSKASIRRQQKQLRLRHRIRAWSKHGAGLGAYAGNAHLPNLKLAAISPIFAVNDAIENQLVAEHRGWRRPLANDLAMGDYYSDEAMGGFLLKISNTLLARGYTFDFDQPYVDEAVGQSLQEFKRAVAGRTS